MEDLILMKGLLVSAGALLIAAAGYAQFTPGRLAVTVVGDGTASLGTTATITRVQEYTLAGGLGFSVTMPTSVSGSNRRLTSSGSATSEGFLCRSVDGNYLTLQGYDAATGTAAIATTASSSVNRVVGRIDMLGNVDTTSAADMYTASNPRSSVSVDGTHFWTGGNSGTAASAGIQNMDLGGANLSQVSNTVNNTRVVNIFNGQLYTSSASGAFIGISSVGTGLPTGSGNTMTLLMNSTTTGTGTASPYDFFFSDANTCYVADDRGSGSGGGIQKWVFSGGSWSASYIMTNGLTTGVRGLCGVVDGFGTVTLYATTTETNANRIVTVTDTGATSLYSTIATAATNTAFRGIDFTPVPEPASILAIGAGLSLLVARRKRS
jgi:hypothetical protein